MLQALLYCGKKSEHLKALSLNVKLSLCPLSKWFGQVAALFYIASWKGTLRVPLEWWLLCLLLLSLSFRAVGLLGSLSQRRWEIIRGLITQQAHSDGALWPLVMEQPISSSGDPCVRSELQQLLFLGLKTPLWERMDLESVGCWMSIVFDVNCPPSRQYVIGWGSVPFSVFYWMTVRKNSQ